MHNFDDIFKRTKTQFKRNTRLTQHLGDRLQTNKLKNI